MWKKTKRNPCWVRQSLAGARIVPKLNHDNICIPSLPTSPTFQEEDLSSETTNQLWLSQVHMSHLHECYQGDENKVLQSIDNLMQSLQPNTLLDKKLPFALKMIHAKPVN